MPSRRLREGGGLRLRESSDYRLRELQPIEVGVSVAGQAGATPGDRMNMVSGLTVGATAGATPDPGLTLRADIAVPGDAALAPSEAFRMTASMSVSGSGGFTQGESMQLAASIIAGAAGTAGFSVPGGAVNVLLSAVADLGSTFSVRQIHRAQLAVGSQATFVDGLGLILEEPLAVGATAAASFLFDARLAVLPTEDSRVVIVRAVDNVAEVRAPGRVASVATTERTVTMRSPDRVVVVVYED